MIGCEDLKKIKRLASLSDPMLEKLLNITSMEALHAGETIYTEDQQADKMYGIISGQVCLGVKNNCSKTVWILDLYPGQMFGVCSVIEDQDHKHMTLAKVTKTAKLLTWRGDEIKGLLKKDYEMGFVFMTEIVRNLKKRLQAKNAQFTCTCS